MMSKKNWLIFFSLAAIAIFGWLIFTSVEQSRTKTATLTVEIAPSGSKLNIDGDGAKEGVIKVKPGSITVTVSKDGFELFEETVLVTKDQNKYVGIILKPNSQQTANWYQNHPQDQQKAEGISSKEYDIVEEAATENQPLIEKLPFIGPGFEYRIDYGESKKNLDQQTPAIYITAAAEEAKKNARAWIRSQGYSLSDLEIIYINKAP